MTVMLLLGAGHETTANLVSNGVLALLRDPAQLRRLAEHPEAAAAATEELLRYDPPVQLVSRVARNDLELGGAQVRAGDQALVLLGACGRDPARHADPERLDLQRRQAGHLAFGYGPHFCAGAGLARLEAAEVLRGIAPLTLGWDPDAVRAARDGSRTFRRVTTLHVAAARDPVPR
jgi:cytochrome P450